MTINAAELKKMKKDDLVNLLTTLAQQATVTQEEPKELTSKEQADALIEASPFTHTSGRVYLGGATIEAAARVSSTGKPELVKADVKGRTAAVALWRTEQGSVAAQNLRKV